MEEKPEKQTDKYRLPRPGDQLIRQAEYWTPGVDFPQDSLTRESCMWEGYFDAGEVLINTYQEDPYQNVFLIYPIFFNYRHAFEIAMKMIINKYGNETSREKSKKSNHDLQKIWEAYKGIAIEFGAVLPDDEQISAVEDVINELHKVDPTGMAFRYPETKKGSLFPLPSEAIDFENVKVVMSSINTIFVHVDSHIGELFSSRGQEY